MMTRPDGSPMTPLEAARFVRDHPELIRSNPQWRELVQQLASELEKCQPTEKAK